MARTMLEDLPIFEDLSLSQQGDIHGAWWGGDLWRGATSRVTSAASWLGNRAERGLNWYAKQRRSVTRWATHPIRTFRKAW